MFTFDHQKRYPMYRKGREGPLSIQWLAVGESGRVVISEVLSPRPDGDCLRMALSGNSQATLNDDHHGQACHRHSLCCWCCARRNAAMDDWRPMERVRRVGRRVLSYRRTQRCADGFVHVFLAPTVPEVQCTHQAD